MTASRLALSANQMRLGASKAAVLPRLTRPDNVPNTACGDWLIIPPRPRKGLAPLVRR